MGRTPDYMNVKFSCFAARRDVWAGADGGNAEGADNLEVVGGVWFPDPRPLMPMRSLLATWFPRVAEIIALIGSHNLLATPSRRQLDDPELRPLLDEFLHGAGDIDAEARAALFRLAWDFVGSGLAGRNLFYERFYLTSAARNRIAAHAAADRRRAYELVDSILARGRGAPGP